MRGLVIPLRWSSMAEFLASRNVRNRIRVALALPALLSASSCFWPGLPDVAALRTEYPVVHVVRKGRRKIGAVTLVRRRPAGWVELRDVSKLAIGAIIVSEDWAFYQHKGYDPNQIREALSKDLAEKKFARGASTITQQVARNVFLDQEKTLMRKLKELYLAVQLEKKLNKGKILEIYLNVAQWGDGLYGIGPAARHYFDKSPSDLNAKEGAFLAMLLPSPVRYSVSFRDRHLTAYARDTVETILDKMQQAHFLTADQKMAELERPLSFEVSGDTLDPVPAPLPSEEPPAPEEPEDPADSTNSI